MKKQLIFMFAALLSLTSASCIFDGCSEETKAEASSPDGAVTATLLERNCGATTPYVAHVNLRFGSGPLQPGEDGVIKEGQIFLMKGRAQWIKLAWEGPKSLVIECQGCATNPNVAKTDHWQDISIGVKNVGSSN